MTARTNLTPALGLALLMGSALPAAAQLTNNDILAMRRAGFDAETIVRAIEANEPAFDTSAAALLALKESGVDERILSALLARQRAPLAPADVPAAEAEDADAAAVFLEQAGQRTEIEPEIAHWRTGGVAKMWLLGTRGHRNGVLAGPHSRGRVAGQLEFILRCPAGTAVTEFQLLKLWEKEDRREFRLWTGGFIHESSGAEPTRLPFDFEKIAPRTYRVRLARLPRGEYGFLPPGMGQVGFTGAVAGGPTGPLLTTPLKLYTFRVVE